MVYEITLQDVSDVREFAHYTHDNVNQKYSKTLPYGYHLDMVWRMARKYSSLLPKEKVNLVQIACLLHDTLEDTHLTYNDLKAELAPRVGESHAKEICEIVYAVTNEKGRNRKERANAKYYVGIKETKYATFVKLCDRLANVLHGVMSGSTQVDMYRKENDDFLLSLESKEFYKYADMVYDLKCLLEVGIFNFTELTKIHEVL